MVIEAILSPVIRKTKRLKPFAYATSLRQPVAPNRRGRVEPVIAPRT